jgi:hypothetical protein
VSKDGQQDFHNEANVKYLSSLAAALAEAKATVLSGKRIFPLDIDADGGWSEVSN